MGKFRLPKGVVFYKNHSRSQKLLKRSFKQKKKTDDLSDYTYLFVYLLMHRIKK
jgi:hypothetical protein